MISGATTDSRTPPLLCGLVLAGGKSSRMGRDKSNMMWHGREQKYYLAGLLGDLCPEVYISCRADQAAEIESGFPVITDLEQGAGPAAGILAAFACQPHAAWLVVACDLPLVDLHALRYLVDNRDRAKIATTYISPHDGLPEPLVTIWEPAARQVLQRFVSEGFSCPRKALIRNEEQVKRLSPLYPEALMNANTPQDAAMVQQVLDARL